MDGPPINKPVPPQKPPVAEGTTFKQKSPVPEKPHPIQQKWNGFLRIIKYFILSSIILTLMEIGVAYWLVSSRWHLLLPKEEMITYAREVAEAEPLPSNFMRVYTANFPRHLHTTLTQQIFINYGTRFLLRHTELDQKPHCFCDMVYDIQKKKHQELEDLEWDGRLQDLEFGFGIEKYASPDKCFYYVMRYRIQEQLSHLNPKRYSHLTDKTLEQFSDDELIELILLLKARNRYNRYRNPARFEKEFAAYKARLTTANPPVANP